MDDSSDLHETPDAAARTPSADAPIATFVEAPTTSLSAHANASGYSASTFYRPMELLGAGGLGRVWLAHDERVDREVAIKELHPKVAGNADVLARFYREADILARLQHPNIAPFFHVGIDDADRPFLVMQRIGGDTLGERVQIPRAAGLDWSVLHSELHELVVVILKVCEGIAYAHSRGVVHRDLKPANIMIGEFGEVIILDWGLGKELSVDSQPDAAGTFARSLEAGGEAEIAKGETGLTIPGSLIGTLAYMAPEQARGSDSGLPADVFGLGGILYFVLTGRPPHEIIDASAQNAALRIQSTQVRPAIEVNPTVPRPLSAIAAKATALRMEDRYASATQLATDLRRWLAGDPVSAYREPWLQRCARWTLRHRRTASIVALAAFSVVLVVVVSNLHLWASTEGMVTQELADMRERVDDVADGIEREVQLTAALMNFLARIPSLRDALQDHDEPSLRDTSLFHATRAIKAFMEQQPHVLDVVMVDGNGGAVVEDAIMKPLADDRRIRKAIQGELKTVLSVPPGELLIAWSAQNDAKADRLKTFLPVIVGAPVRSDDRTQVLGAVFMETQISFHAFQPHDTPNVAFADCFYADHTGRIRFCSLNSGALDAEHEGMPWIQRIFPELSPLIAADSLPANVAVRLSGNRHSTLR